MDKNISQSDRFGIRTEGIWYASTKNDYRVMHVQAKVRKGYLGRLQRD